MTEIVQCARCKCSFERTCVETDEGLDCTTVRIIEQEPVCDDCEHEFLAWAGCPPLC